MSPVITAAVEGITDEAVAGKLISHVGARLGTVHGRQGKSHLKQRLSGYNHAARHAPWFMLVDLDRDADCVPPIRQEWLPHPSPMACFRVAVREIEAWLMADAEALAAYLGVASNRIPDQPETLVDPKAVMVELARFARRKAIRDDMVPRTGSGRAVGPAYSSRLVEYVADCWRPDVAATHADSLARAIRALRRLVAAVA
jgi:hypothetical protein